jgi:hypothetical protein
MRDRGSPARARLRRWTLAAAVLALLSAACPPRDPYPCSAPFTPTEPIQLDYPRARMVYQRDPASGHGDIAIRGTYDGAPTAIEARWGRGPWTVVDPAPAGGRFAGTLPDLPTGWGRFQVRFAGDVSSTVSLTHVGIGNVIGLLGQSNMVMMLSTLHASGLGASALQMPDHIAPDDPGAVKWAADPLHECEPALGSIWPALGDHVIEATGWFPLMFIAAARGGTGLVSAPDWQPGGSAYQTAVAQLHLGTGDQMCPAALLYLQGETDAGGGVSQADYEAALTAMGDGLQAELHCARGPVPIVVGVIGAIDRNLDPSQVPIPAEQVAAIQAAQRRAPLLRPYFRPGPDTSSFDVFPVFDLHFTDEAFDALLDGWCRAIDGVGGLACF